MDREDLDLLNKIESLHTWIYAKFIIKESCLDSPARSEIHEQLAALGNKIENLAMELGCKHISCNCSPIAAEHPIRNRIFLPQEENIFVSCPFCYRTFCWDKNRITIVKSPS